MPTTVIKVSTGLQPETVLKRLQFLADDLLKEHGRQIVNLNHSMNDSVATISFALNGITLKGRLFLDPGMVRLEIVYPWKALPYKKTAKQQISEVLQALLN